MKFLVLGLLTILIGNSNGLVQYKVQSYSLCDIKPLKSFVEGVKSLYTDPVKISLGKGSDSAMSVEQVWTTENVNKIKNNCTFLVKSYDQQVKGVYVYMKKLKLRKDDLSQCVDYIQFSGNRKTPGTQLCGNYMNQHLYKHEGDLAINIFINTRYPLEEPLELSMVITAYTQCDKKSDLVCNEDANECISKSLVNDGYLNCFPPCRDEGNSCLPMPKILPVTVSPSNIALTALTSLIFTMVAVSAFIWLVYKYRKFCCPAAPARRNSGDVPTIEMPTSPIAAGSTNAATAPPIKDLPPSYESLFPDR